jgi:hypothetical protein
MNEDDMGDDDRIVDRVSEDQPVEEKIMEKTFREIEKNKFECLHCLKIVCKMSNILQHLKSQDKCSKCGKECSGRNASGNLKQHEKKC